MTSELSSQGYEELISHTVDVLTVLDDSGTIQYESPSVETLLGYEPSELMGESVFKFVHPNDRQRALIHS